MSTPARDCCQFLREPGPPRNSTPRSLGERLIGCNAALIRVKASLKSTSVEGAISLPPVCRLGLPNKVP